MLLLKPAEGSGVCISYQRLRKSPTMINPTEDRGTRVGGILILLSPMLRKTQKGRNQVCSVLNLARKKYSHTTEGACDK